MNLEEIKTYLAERYAFETVQELPVDEIVTSLDLRKCCDQNACGRFNTCWSCPPAIPAFEECDAQVRRYQYGLLIHQSYLLEDEYDFEGMFDANKEFEKEFRKAYLDLREKDPSIFGLGAGSCSLCEKCTYPDAPCRFPDKRISSLESYGISVFDMAKKCGVRYRKSPQHIDYYGMIFIQ